MIFFIVCLYHFHEWVKKGLEKSGFGEFSRENSGKNPDLIVISNELGYGVVPIDAFDRKYRESTGRLCTQLAAKADRSSVWYAVLAW